MKNSELLALDELPTDPYLRHRLYALRIETDRMPCPKCGMEQSRLDMSNIPLDEYNVIELLPNIGQCINCKHSLRYTIPPIAGGGNYWCWSLSHRVK